MLCCVPLFPCCVLVAMVRLAMLRWAMAETGYDAGPHYCCRVLILVVARFLSLCILRARARVCVCFGFNMLVPSLYLSMLAVLYPASALNECRFFPSYTWRNDRDFKRCVSVFSSRHCRARRLCICSACPCWCGVARFGSCCFDPTLFLSPITPVVGQLSRAHHNTWRMNGKPR